MGALVIAAAGNASLSTDEDPTYPAQWADTLAPTSTIVKAGS